MKTFKKLRDWIKRKRIYPTWESMPDGLLLLFFITSSLPASYWSYVVAKLYDPYINAFNQAGFTFMGMAAPTIMFLLAINAWFFGCISARTGKLIFDRWFK